MGLAGRHRRRGRRRRGRRRGDRREHAVPELLVEHEAERLRSRPRCAHRTRSADRRPPASPDHSGTRPRDDRRARMCPTGSSKDAVTGPVHELRPCRGVEDSDLLEANIEEALDRLSQQRRPAGRERAAERGLSDARHLHAEQRRHEDEEAAPPARAERRRRRSTPARPSRRGSRAAAQGSAEGRCRRRALSLHEASFAAVDDRLRGRAPERGNRGRDEHHHGRHRGRAPRPRAGAVQLAARQCRGAATR